MLLPSICRDGAGAQLRSSVPDLPIKKMSTSRMENKKIKEEMEPHTQTHGGNGCYDGA
jgi:hypothetical protein